MEDVYLIVLVNSFSKMSSLLASIEISTVWRSRLSDVPTHVSSYRNLYRQLLMRFVVQP